MPRKLPVVKTLPEASTAMSKPWLLLPPMLRAQTKLPALSSFDTKTSLHDVQTPVLR